MLLDGVLSGFRYVYKKLNGCLREVSKVFQGCSKEVLSVFQGRLRGVLRVPYGLFKEASRYLKQSSKGVSRQFQRCF